jgi:hydrogenase expression/formation protein HypD
MKYMHEYRDHEIAEKLIQEIRSVSKKHVRLMEVCGGHTMAIRKYSIDSLLPNTVELLSGPGCPVCVTGQDFIDKAIALAQRPDVILTTYGDLIRVPGSKSNLDQAKALGADIRIVYSTLEALRIASENPDKKIVFLGIGFETTAPSTAISLQQAKKQGIKNYFVLSAHKTMPNAMAALIEGGSQIDGYIGPGHVSTIAGSKIYNELVNQYNLSIVISGFEPVDILQSILMLVKQLEQEKPKLEIQYKRAVKAEGNIKAQEIVDEVFEPCESYWRGIGNIKDSGMKIRGNYELFDADKHFELQIDQAPEPKGCICGAILKGLNKPTDCKLFGKACVPENPVGACMVSGEGTCAAYYRYR